MVSLVQMEVIMGGRGSSSGNNIPIQPGYARAVELAKQDIKKEEAELIKQTERIRQSIKEKNEGIQKYAKLNEQWKAKVDKSFRLAKQGKLAEADKVYAEGREIYESIPKDYRID